MRRGYAARLSLCFRAADVPGVRTAASIESPPGRLRDVRLPAGSRYRLRIGRTVRDVVFSRNACAVGPAEGSPHVEIVTDAATWADMDAGRLSGIEAFAQRRLVVRGSIDKSLLRSEERRVGK